MQKVHVLGKSFLRAIVCFLDYAGNFRIDELCCSLRNFAPGLELASEEKLLLVVSNENRPDRIGKSPLPDLPAGK